ncbi:uncharacterized protein VNE69_05115 [Vairimorpha necatrix]|uniref:Uncharacterized protein n=1 Tax=Vairimorpha necatrix TaxID=6039 RepID=A0AAX4JC20_9MICR
MKRIIKNKEYEENKKKELEFEEVTSKFIAEERIKMEGRICNSYDKIFDDEVKEIRMYKQFLSDYEYNNKFKIDNAEVEDDIEIISKL